MSALKKYHKIYLLELFSRVDQHPELLEELKIQIGSFGMKHIEEARAILNTEARTKEQ